eukprot:3959443-Amphidinium_carterae.1
MFSTVSSLRRVMQQLTDGPYLSIVFHAIAKVQRPDLQFEAAWVLTNIASGALYGSRVRTLGSASPQS